MSEVDDDPVRLAELDAFHPAGHDRDAGEAVTDGRRVEPDRLAERDHGKGVMNVEAPHEAEVHGGAPGRRVIGDPQPTLVLLDTGRPDVRGRVRAIRQDPRPGLLRDTDEGAGGRIVGVDDARRGPAERLDDVRRQPLEEPQLRVAVRLPGAVQLEVLVGQVGQDRHVVGDGVDPPERQPVRRRLDHRGRIAGAGHRPDRSLELWRLGSRGVGLVRRLDAADPGLGRAGHPGPDAGCLEGRDREERCRRLAVRPGDPDDRQVATRIAVPPGGRGGQGRPAVGHDELRQVDLGQRVLDDGGRRACRGCRRDVLVAVDVETRDGHEQRAGPDLARVVGHAAYRDRGQAGRPDRAAVAAGAGQPVLDREPLDEPVERRCGRGLGRIEQLGERRLGHRPSTLVSRLARRPAP